ncbi:AfsR/SARP family transcriptional regulator [Streptomyces sp. NPDC088766]|uniref:AfsR/SARP family transcriptional regulator n=1 Tax=Streptomyces sp. NPDC088766 TaxID=3365893 RepID=UPI00380D9B7C
MEWEIRLSGSVDVRAAGQRSDPGSTKSRLTLAVLAWEAGRTVSMDTLIHRVWDDHPPVKAREALHTHVSRIRSALRVIDGADAPAIVSRTNSYALHADPDHVDLRCYANRVGQARSLRQDDAESALLLLSEAEDIWHGEPLTGITGSWAEHVRTTVAETRLGAAMTRAEILIGMERFADAVPVLLPLAEAHPVDEALIEQLALALHGSSRTAEATRLLQRTRQRVIRDIGLDAGQRLHRVQQGILSGAPAAALLGHTATVSRSHAGPPRRVPDNLPRDVPWVGRRDELRRLTAALCEGDEAGGTVVAVEAIDGMGGVGKTSLAVHLAHRLRDRFPGGRLFLHLGGHASDRTAPTPARALTELLRLLGTDAKDLPHETDELAALWRAAARERRMLVILDDATGPGQVRPLLPGASPTAVVVTSRRRLPGLPGVRPVSLDVLPRDDAIALFEQRLGARRGARQSEIAEIVHICGFLPLAIEIAASRLLTHPSWTTRDLLAQLTEGAGSLAELRDGERTMTHVFALSYRALSPEQQLVFRRAGLHFGTEFGPPAVAALSGLSLGTTERVLEELLVNHLISEPAPHRFTMHDLLRVYARSLTDADEFESSDDSRPCMRRLVDHYVATADRADRLAYPFRSRMTVDLDGSRIKPRREITDAHAAEEWLITEGGNLLEALTWIAEHGPEHQLANSVHVLAGFLDMEGHPSIAEPLLRRAVTHWDGTGDEASKARALLDLSTVYTHSSRYEEAISAARAALTTARALDDTALENGCIHQLTVPLWQTGRYKIAQSLQKKSLELLKQTQDKLQTARSENLLGITHLHLAESDEALACFRSTLSAFREMGDDRGIYSTLNNLAELHRKAGEPGTAERFYRQAISVAAGMGSRRDSATLHMNLASVLEALGKPDEARELYERILPVLRDVGDLRAEAITLNGIGRAHRAAGHGERSLSRHLAALVLARRIHAAGEEIDILHDLAQAEHDAGRLAQAVAHLEESRSLSRRVGASSEEVRAARALERIRERPGGLAEH